MASRRVRAPPPGGVQSLDRAFAILEAMADAGGVIGLSQLATQAELPLATIHRLVRTLVDLGYVRQEPSRQYSLGPRLMRLADASTSGSDARPPVHDRVVARARRVGQPRGARRRRDRLRGPGAALEELHADVHRGRPARQPHATAVGKAMLAARPSTWSRAAQAYRDAAPHRAHDHHPGGCSPTWTGCGSAATRSTTASRRSACAASRSPSRALRARWRSRCPGR